MNTTDFETELRATLDAAGRLAPETDNLAERATRPVRRRRGAVAAGAAAFGVLAVAATVAVIGPDRSGQGPIASPQSSPATSSTPSSTASLPYLGPTSTRVAALLGSWRPLDIPGVDKADLAGTNPNFPPVITFTKKGEWTGGDGCNAVAGKYSADDDGTFRGRGGLATLIACKRPGVPHGDVLKAATHFRITGPLLTFTAPNGRTVGTYQRA